MPSTPATLYIVATPIGNLEDISLRARRMLSEVALIAAEDTRHSARLMAHLEIKTPMVSLHEHNEQARLSLLLERLKAGDPVALISDAGTPLISDPGFALVRAAHAADIPVHCVPGPCAAIAAMSVAGLPSDRFVFEGFLPARAGARRNRLAALARETRTLVFHESSHRIGPTLADIAREFGDAREVSLCRELTKRHEQSVRLSAAEMGDWLAADDNRRRGEFVLVVAGAPEVESRAGDIPLDGLLQELLAITGTRQAAKIAARLTGVARNEAYTRALALQ